MFCSHIASVTCENCRPKYGPPANTPTPWDILRCITPRDETPPKQIPDLEGEVLVLKAEVRVLKEQIAKVMDLVIAIAAK